MNSKPEPTPPNPGPKLPPEIWRQIPGETYEEYDSFLAYLGHCVRMAVDPARDGGTPPTTSVDTATLNDLVRIVSHRNHWSARATAWFMHFALVLQAKFPPTGVPLPIPGKK